MANKFEERICSMTNNQVNRNPNDNDMPQNGHVWGKISEIGREVYSLHTVGESRNWNSQY